MDVARAAGREAVSNLNAPIEHPMPGAALPPVCPTRDPGRLFTRASHAVRQAMALETRIAAGNLPSLHVPASPHPLKHGPEHGPRQATGQKQPHAGASQTSRPAFRMEGLERLEDEDAFGNNRSAPEILAAIRQVIGVSPNIGPTCAAIPHRTKAPAPATPRQPPPGPLQAPKSRPPPRPG